MSEKYIYTIADLSKKHGPKEILKNIWLSFYPGAKIGVLGKNGAGKSTLLRIMAGQDKNFDGEARLADGYSVGYLSQEPQLNPEKNVQGNVDEAVDHIRAILRRFDEINNRLSEVTDPAEMEKLLGQQVTVQDEIDLHNAWELDRTVEIAMDAMNLPPGDADVTKLSGGERRRVALCKILLEKPDLLLLDEPTNHLDAESVNWLERHLADYSGTVVAVTHDRYFLDNVAKWILELDRGRGIPWEGNYSSWLGQKKSRLEVEEKQATARQKTLERELEWIRLAPRPARPKAKPASAPTSNSPRSASKNANRNSKFKSRPANTSAPSSSKLKDVSKAYGDNLLFENLSFRLPPGGIVGVIGPNGAGKTTLFRLITGEEKADKGEVKIGETVELGYVDQNRDALKADNTVYQEISGGTDFVEMGGTQNQLPRLLGPFQLHRPRSAEEGRRSFRRRTQPRPLSQAPPPRLQRAASRRTHQRSRCRHPAGARRSNRQLRRLRRRHQPRPLVPRPHRHPHHRLRRRRLHPRLRRQLPSLRRRTQTPLRPSRRRTPQIQIQKTGALT